MRPRTAINPAEVNVDPGRLARALDVLRDGIAEGALPGGVVCALRRGQMFLHEAIGTRDGTHPATTDTIYDLASVTKPMATAASVLTLVEQGRLALTATLPTLLGEAAAHRADVTIRHLLTHTSGLPAHRPLYRQGDGLDSAVAAILRLPAAPPGTQYAYSCLGFILLARIVEIVSGKKLNDFAREHVFTPLGLEHTTFHPPKEMREYIAPTRSLETIGEGESAEADLVGTVHDGNARGIERTACDVSGNAGLFGTARDVATFGEALRLSGCGGASVASGANAGAPHRLFGTPTIARILSNQISPEIGSHTLMFFAQGNGLCPAGDLLSPRAVGHSGYTGIVLTLDPEYDLTLAVLTNRVLTDPDGARWLSVRRRFLNALAAALC